MSRPGGSLRVSADSEQHTCSITDYSRFNVELRYPKMIIKRVLTLIVGASAMFASMGAASSPASDSTSDVPHSQEMRVSDERVFRVDESDFPANLAVGEEITRYSSEETTTYFSPSASCTISRTTGKPQLSNGRVSASFSFSVGSGCQTGIADARLWSQNLIGLWGQRAFKTWTMQAGYGWTSSLTYTCGGTGSRSWRMATYWNNGEQYNDASLSCSP